MGNVFGKKKTVAEILKDAKRLVNRSIRELQREQRGMEREEKQLIADIKKHAKLQQMDIATLKAKDLVRTRNYIKKFIKLGSQLQAVNLKMTTAKTQETMMRSMKNVTRAMKAMNKAMKPAKLQELMKQFAQLDEQLEFKSEMMGDAIDDAVAEEGDEEEQEEVLSKVFDELGFQFDREVPNAPTKDIAAPQAVGSAAKDPGLPVAVAGSDVDDLEARLNNLKK
mmetsp:Transcript_2806/g.4308  ORF Transcript_2806/g.4308 Transcript_2806/m.4308 type:complete len:224 (-) Transcript_2806:80-751(-)|eukprot:CAMPEP_0195530354 /NCGR_PEP_ID=MMETSP0794_2-20130614/33206_1 /TAXON_ID=515487 /ORGANISM="Stephanopyxis turris, Strain CCMP 815" /LENGTH=223 /DNA_ID=CAMNT_0040661843 /DNA_START=95 /DNA_END=766 /DNA_ORIENTATION=+